MNSSRHNERVAAFVERLLDGAATNSDEAVAADPGRSYGPFDLDLHVRSEDGEITVEWSADLIAGWRITTRWKHRDGAVRCAGISIDESALTATTPDTALFKKLNLGALHRQVEAEFRRPTTLFLLWEPWVSTIAKDGIAIPRPGRRGRDQLYYAEWARRYVEACSIAPRSPLKHLVATSPAETEGTIRAFLNRARAKGLLTKAPAGKSGGELTRKARELLKEGT